MVLKILSVSAFCFLLLLAFAPAKANEELLPCTSDVLINQASDAIFDDYLRLGLSDKPPHFRLKDSDDPLDLRRAQLYLPMIPPEDIAICVNVNERAIPGAVIQFVNPHTGQTGGVVIGYGAMTRTTRFGSTDGIFTN